MSKQILRKMLSRIDEKNSWGKLELRALLLELLLEDSENELKSKPVYRSGPE